MQARSEVGLLGEQVKLSGFASLAGGKTVSVGKRKSPLTGEETDNTYLVDLPDDGFYDDQWSFYPDSIYGLQISAQLSEKLSLVGQFTGSGADSFDAKVTWAYMKYQFENDAYIIAGKQRTPYLYYSDSFDVGYSYHWIRPPN